MNKKREIIPSEVGQHFWKEQQKITSVQEWISFLRAYKCLSNAVSRGPRPFDPKFNSILWAFDVAKLCHEIAFSYCWMNSYAKFYKQKVPVGSQPSSQNFHVSYFADNCIIRIDSCRDKLALMVWAFYCAFNPEKGNEVLTYESIMERLKFPIKYGIVIKNQSDFLKNLDILKGTDFKRIERYRHFKIHRIEPRIEIHGTDPNTEMTHMFPLVNQNDIARWEKELETTYPDEQFRELVKKGCYVHGILFGRRNIKDRTWDFKEVQKHTRSCLIKLLSASDKCFRTLRKRSPFRKKGRRIKKVSKL